MRSLHLTGAGHTPSSVQSSITELENPILSDFWKNARKTAGHGTEMRFVERRVPRGQSRFILRRSNIGRCAAEGRELRRRPTLFGSTARRWPAQIRDRRARKTVDQPVVQVTLMNDISTISARTVSFLLRVPAAFTGRMQTFLEEHVNPLAALAFTRQDDSRPHED